MTDGSLIPRPTPANMRHRRSDLRPRTARRQPKFAVDPSIPKRFEPVDKALCDTGFLYTIAMRNGIFTRFLNLYAGTLVITEAVEKEIRDVAGMTPGPQTTGGMRLMIMNAKRIMQEVGRGAILVHRLASGDEDMLGPVGRQLREADEDRRVRAGVDPNERVVDVTKKNAGEVYSIVAAVSVLKSDRTAVLLTNDGPASRVAQTHHVRSRHLAHVLQQLGCEEPQLTAEQLFEAYEAATKHFGTLPEDTRPQGPVDLRCEADGKDCPRCPVMVGRLPG